MVTGTLENVFINFGTNNPFIANLSAPTQTIAFPIRVGASNFQLSLRNGSIILDRFDYSSFGATILGNTGATLRIRGSLLGTSSEGLRIAQSSTVQIVGTPLSQGPIFVHAGRLDYATSGGAGHTNAIYLSPTSAQAQARLRLSAPAITVSNIVVIGGIGSQPRTIESVATGSVWLAGAGILNAPDTYFHPDSSSTIVLAGAWSGTGRVSHIGPGTTWLTGTNVFSGPIVITNGLLRVSGSPQNSGPYTNTGARLQFDVTPGSSHTNRITLNGFSPRLQFASGATSIANPIVIAAGGDGLRQILNFSTQPVSIAGNATISATIVFSNEPGGAIHFTGTNNLTSGARRLHILGQSAVVIERSLTNGSLVKGGPGELVIGHSNSFVNLTIEEGVVQLTGTLASINGQYILGPPSGTSNVTLAIRNSGLLITNSISVRAAGSRLLQALYTSGVSTLGGPITFLTNLTIDVSSNAVLLATNTWVGAAAFQKVGAGRLELQRNSSFQGNSWISSGVVRVTVNNALGSVNGSNFVVSGATLEITNNVRLPEHNIINGSGVDGLGAIRHLGGDAALLGRTHVQTTAVIRVDSGTLTLRGPCLGSGVSISNSGPGSLIFSNNHAFSGQFFAQSGSTYLRGTLSNASVTVSSGATFIGTGVVSSLSVSGLLEIGRASNLTGRLRATNGVQLQPGGAAIFTIAQATGLVLGVARDFLDAASSAIAINATTSQPFTIYLSGNPTGWTNTSFYSWQIASGGVVTAFASNKFSINTSNFTAPIGSGSFHITNSGSALFIVFHPALQNPSNITAVADGPEMVRLSWQPVSGAGVIIAYNRTNPPPALISGNTYTSGMPLGDGASVIYVGSGSNLEHVVTPNELHQYRLFSYVGVAYSDGAYAVTSTPQHASLIAENFSYTNGLMMSSNSAGGVGWAGPWAPTSGAYRITNTTLTLPAGYFPRGGNSLFLPASLSATNAVRARSFSQAFTSGSVYISFSLRASSIGTNRFLGVELLSNGVGRLFWGLPRHQATFGIRESIASNGANSTIIAATNVDYTLIGRYQFTSRVMTLNIYPSNTLAPQNEPVVWAVAYTVPVAQAAARLDGLSINIGSLGTQPIGNTLIDEIRVVTNYADLFVVSPPYATNYFAGDNYQISDGQIQSGSYSVSFNFVSDIGITNTSVLPNYDLLMPDGAMLTTNVLFTNLTYLSATHLVASNATQPSVPPLSAQLGIHTLRWSAISASGVIVYDSPYIGSNTPATVLVYDDDVQGPAIPMFSVSGAHSDRTAVFTGFENAEGWNVPIPGGTVWTQAIGSGLASGTWYGTCAIITGSVANGGSTAYFPPVSTGAYIQIPARSNISLIWAQARLSGGTNVRHLALEYWSGSAWSSLGTNEVTSTNFTQILWFTTLSSLTTVRLVRVGADGSPGIVVDHLEMAANAALGDPYWQGWTNETSLELVWQPGIDYISGVDEYRLVEVETNTVPPAATNDGIGLGSLITNYLMDVGGVEGVVTGYLFAIDADDDRQNDRSLGPYRPFTLRIDTTPPLAVTNLQIVPDPGIDDSSEIRIQWTPAANTNMHEAAGWRSDQTPLSPWDTYIVIAIELDANDSPVNTSIYTRLDGYPILGTNAATTIVLSNLNAGTTYSIGVAGRDRAGNIGPFVYVTGATFAANFALTAAFPVVYSTPSVTLAFTGSLNTVYDLIYVDAPSYSDSLSNKWTWLSRITNANPGYGSWTDSGGLNPTGYARVSPQSLGATSRFYRIAAKDRWAPTGGVRLASTRIYSARAILLNPGENWISLHSKPDPFGSGSQASIEYVFGTNRLPAGPTIASSTRISWLGPTEGHPVISSLATCVVWLSSNSGWQYALGGTGSANAHLVPNGEGFLIELPLSSSPTTLVLVGSVPTQTVVHTIPPPSTNSVLFYFFGREIPDTITISNFVKQFSGFGAGAAPNFADEIRVLNNNPVDGVGMGSMIAPRLRAWYSSQPAHSNAPWRRATTGYPSAMSDAIFPNEAIIIVRRTAGVVTWTNKPNYSAPNTTMSP